MQTQLEAAKHALFDEDALHVSDVKLFPGTNREILPQDIAEQINRVIAQLLAGDYEDGEVSCPDASMPQGIRR